MRRRKVPRPEGAVLLRILRRRYISGPDRKAVLCRLQSRDVRAPRRCNWPSDWRSAFHYASMFDQALCGPQWEQLNVFRTSGKWKPAASTGVTPNIEYGGAYWTTNMFASSSAAVLCCKPGEYLTPDEGAPSPPTSVCNSCRTGRYRAAPQDYTNPTSCTTCGLGHAAPDAETACMACEGGRYQDEQDSGAFSTVRLSFGCKVRIPPSLPIFPHPIALFYTQNHH